MKKKEVQVEITAPKMKTVAFTIKGTAPYVQNKFSQKAKEMMRKTQEAGAASKAKTRAQRRRRKSK